MKALPLITLWTFSLFASAQQTSNSRLNLSLEQRFNSRLRVTAVSVTLPDFVGFIATAYKVPLLVETTSPVPDVHIPAGTFSARQLLDNVVGRYTWQQEKGVAHVFQPVLARASGNLLNITVERFYFPRNVADFHTTFRSCLYSMTKKHRCTGGVVTEIIPAWMSKESLPYLEPFKNARARTILLSALALNTHFYVLIAFRSTHPDESSEFPFRNWFTESLVPDEPSPIWVQRRHVR